MNKALRYKFRFFEREKIIYESQAFSLRVDGKLWHHRAHSFLLSASLLLFCIIHSMTQKERKIFFPLLWIRKWKRNKSALEFSYGGTLMKSICCVQKNSHSPCTSRQANDVIFLSLILYFRVFIFSSCTHSWRFILLSHHINECVCFCLQRNLFEVFVIIKYATRRRLSSKSNLLSKFIRFACMS